LTKVRSGARELSRDTLFGLLRQPLRLFIEGLRYGKTAHDACADKKISGASRGDPLTFCNNFAVCSFSAKTLKH